MIVEVRSYRIKPGRRGEFIKLFESRAIEAQREYGMPILGPLLDVENPNKFVFLRSFPSLEERERMKDAFYGSPIWKNELEPIAMPMLDSYDVRVLLDQALGARRRKALGISDSEEPPGQGTAETLHTIQTLLLRLIKRGELVFRRQTVDFKLMREAVIEARAGREVAFEELVAQAFVEKGYTRESINNYFDMKTGIAREYVNGLVATIQKEESREYDQPKASK